MTNYGVRVGVGVGIRDDELFIDEELESVPYWLVPWPVVPVLEPDIFEPDMFEPELPELEAGCDDMPELPVPPALESDMAEVVWLEAGVGEGVLLLPDILSDLVLSIQPEKAAAARVQLTSRSEEIFGFFMGSGFIVMIIFLSVRRCLGRTHCNDCLASRSARDHGV